LSENTLTIGYDSRGFNSNQLLSAIQQLDSSRFVGFAYGSGFEAQPELLQKISEFIPLIGNAASTVAAIKNPLAFFAALQQLNINHPKICSALPAHDAEAYLIKFSGGSGGWHIRYASAGGGGLPAGHYYQHMVAGRAVSLLFLASGDGIEVVGFNEQWCSPAAGMPFRYGGAAGNAELSHSVCQQLVSSATALAQKFHLRGLNSLDAIVLDTIVLNSLVQPACRPTEDERVLVLEINPRLSATLDLYSLLDHSLFTRHVSACLNQAAVDSDIRLNGRSHAHAIVYASHDLEITVAVDWPQWVTDTPACFGPQLTFLTGEPVCTVLVDADDVETAKKIAQGRVEIIQNLLQSLNQNNISS